MKHYTRTKSYQLVYDSNMGLWHKTVRSFNSVTTDSYAVAAVSQCVAKRGQLHHLVATKKLQPVVIVNCFSITKKTKQKIESNQIPITAEYLCCSTEHYSIV